MTTAGSSAPLTALVVATRGGAALAETLASLAWVTRRCVVDPAGVLAGAAWPDAAEPWTPGSVSGWVLLLVEGERATEALAASVGRAVRESAGAYRLPVAYEAFGTSLRLAGGAVRLVRGVRHDVHVRLGGEIGLESSAPVRSLASAPVVRRLPSLPREAVDALNAEAGALAALAAARGMNARALRLPAAGVVGAARVLLGRAREPLGWGRWITAVLAGYRALLAEAKLWEREQLGVVAAR